MNYYFKSYKYMLFIAAALFVVAQPMWAQNDNRISVPLTDPSRPVSLRAHLVSGSITVKGADVKEVVVEARMRNRENPHNEGGPKRLAISTTGLTMRDLETLSAKVQKAVENLYYTKSETLV